ncbi:hypothetical protein SAMN05421869_105301 [Nonomuraea jiangxiensis]|uniref:Uncharacterized protein n=1 Tax=Nonomuraea jiangxiensis TaxID=633440 RepID=A0A1G8K6Q5_9ACTN|nr:hypothetical protein SAMN05421869_105301 [Nonomuraea jiangxiensis]
MYGTALGAHRARFYFSEESCVSAPLSRPI